MVVVAAAQMAAEGEVRSRNSPNFCRIANGAEIRQVIVHAWTKEQADFALTVSMLMAAMHAREELTMMTEILISPNYY